MTPTRALAVLAALAAISSCARDLEPAPPPSVDEPDAVDEEPAARPGELDTVFTSTPSLSTTDRGARFEFTSPREGATFTCSLDGAEEAACTSPFGYFGLPPGPHTFLARARDGLDVDETPAKHVWTIVGTTSSSDAGTAGPGCVGPACEGALPEVEPNGTLAEATDLGAPPVKAGASLTPVDDVDVFTFTLPAHASLKIETYGAGGPATCTGDTLVELMDAAGAVLASDDDGQGGGCSKIAGVAGARGLPPGQYAVRVSSPTSDEVLGYVLQISYESLCGNGVREVIESCDDANVEGGDGCAADCMPEPVCGDGAVTGDEACDDGNTADGDLCSAQCLLGEREPNDAPDVANALPVPGSTSGMLPDGGLDFDHFRVELAAGAALKIFTSAVGDAADCDGDTVIDVLDAAGVSVARDDDSGFASCSLLDGATNAAVRLAPGAYTIRVKAYGSTGTSYGLHVEVLSTCGDGAVGVGETCDDGAAAPGDGCSAVCGVEPVCGDGQLVAPEECDDGAAVDGDGCDGACRFERDEAEPNADVATANPLTLPAVFTAAISPAADVDVFRLELAAPAGIRAQITSAGDAAACPGDTLLHLLDGSGAQLASDDDDGEGACSKLDPSLDGALRMLPAGTYHLRAKAYSSTTVLAAYALRVEVLWTCGDGAQGTGERCDDGNLVDGDGCTATCLEETAEVEPNDSLETAVDLGAPDATTTAALVPGTDRDFFKITLARTTALHVETYGVAGPGTCGGDTYLELLSSTGTTILSDDEDGFGNCSKIDPLVDTAVQALAAGTYYVKVRPFGSAAIEGYGLDVRAAWSCGDGTVAGLEQCDDGNAIETDGCSSTCRLDETEGNDTRGTADDLGALPRTFSAALATGGDLDFFRFTLALPGSVRVTTTGPDGSCGGDTVLALMDAAGVVVARADQNGLDPCAVIDPAVEPGAADLPAGTYTVRVSAFDQVAIPLYWLRVEAD